MRNNSPMTLGFVGIDWHVTTFSKWPCILALAMVVLAHSNVAIAVDATDQVTDIDEIGKWQVVEFAGNQQLIYRVATDATNVKEHHLVIDVVPMNNCDPTPALLIAKQREYSPDLANGLLPFAFKVPGQQEAMDLTQTTMQEGDVFAFFQFKQLTAERLSASNGLGKMAIWIPASGDGSVNRSGNIYFPLEGFSVALQKARELCKASL